MTALEKYVVLIRALFAARRAAPDGKLTQEEESARAEALDDLWYEMTNDERERAEKEVERMKGG